MLSFPFSSRRITAGLASELRRMSVEFGASLILSARSFSEMFTSYSHRLPVRPASGLEIRNGRQNRQEKN
jgi:hypothetical protein